MTGPARRDPVTWLRSVLHIRAGDHRGPPTADFACHVCGHTEAASGQAAVAAFAGAVRQRHAEVCPGAITPDPVPPATPGRPVTTT